MTERSGGAGTPALEGGSPARETFLPFHRPIIGEEEIAEVVDTLRSGWLTTGPRTRRFEQAFAAYVGARNAIGLNSCTAGIHLALVAAGVGPGQEVLMPAVCFPATANMVVNLGGVPVLVDVERDTLALDTALLRASVSPRTTAIIVVHFAGHPCDMEDCAHALEATYRGRRVGSIGDYAAYSFYATKNITTGEGGMLVTRHGDQEEKLRILSLHGISRDAWKRHVPREYEHWETLYPGFKYNMFDIQAALGLHQLRRAGEWLEVRKRWTDLYDDAFQGLEFVRPLVRRDYAGAAYHLYVLLLETEKLRVDRDRILQALQGENIGIGVHFRSLHLHAFYRERFPRDDLPIAEWASSRILSLPLYPALREEDVRDVIRAVEKVVRYYAR